MFHKSGGSESTLRAISSLAFSWVLWVSWVSVAFSWVFSCSIMGSQKNRGPQELIRVDLLSDISQKYFMWAHFSCYDVLRRNQHHCCDFLPKLWNLSLIAKKHQTQIGTISECKIERFLGNLDLYPLKNSVSQYKDKD